MPATHHRHSEPAACTRPVARAAWIGLMLGGMVGCTPTPTPNLGSVRGVVTLDGTPLPNATVRFTPSGPGRTSQGVTDEGGRFHLSYLRNIPGANVDLHVVRITTAGEQTAGRERLPPRYHAQSLLEARVAAGENVIDFALTSK